MGYENFLAFRYIRPKRRWGFINLITVISIGGVMLSVAGLIVVISVMNGFDRDIRDKIIGTNAHVMVNPYGRNGIRDSAGLLEKIRALPEVAAASPIYQNQVMLKSESGVLGVIVEGILPREHIKVANLKEMMKQGDLMALEPETDTASARALTRAAAVMLGAELASNLNVTLGQELTLFTPIFKMTPLGMMPKVAKVRVAGIFKTDFYEYDSGLLYISLPDAQNLFDAPGAVTHIEVRVKDLNQAAGVAGQIQAMDTGINFWAKDWLGMHHNLFMALAIEKMIMFIILACMVVVAAFNIISTLIMVVMEKQKDIGVLKSLGAPHQGIMKIFVYQGLVIGLFGTFFGVALGLGLCALIPILQIPIPGGGQVYYIQTLPVDVQWADIMVILGVAFVTCFAATLYPAYKGSRLDPVEAIRYE